MRTLLKYFFLSSSEKERMKESKDANNSLELDKNPEVTTTAMLKALSRLTYAVFMINFYMIRHMYDMARSPFGVYTYSLVSIADNVFPMEN